MEKPSRRRLRLGALALFLSFSLLLSACGGSAPAPSGNGGSGAPTSGSGETLQVAIGIDADTLDPAGQTTTTIQNMVDYVVETLVTMDQNGDTQPLLAESWETSPDGLTLTFHLKKGIQFHDGTPFNAEAVKFSMERLLNPEVKVPLRAPYTVIESVEAPSEDRVVFHLKQPSPALVAALTSTAAGIISPASVDRHGNTFTNYQHPVGTGPYVFKEWAKNDHITLIRNESYWGNKPYYGSVTFKVVPEAATRESMLLAGQADIIILPPISDLQALEKNPKVKVLKAPSNRTIFIVINNQDPVLSDKRVRQALNYAVDKKSIIQNVLFGAAEELDAPMSKALFGYCSVGTYAYDPDKARTLLAEAGHPTLTLRFMSPTGRYVQDFQAAQAIAADLAKVGVKTDLQTMDWPTYVATMTKPVAENTTQLHLLGWAPGFMDAQQQMEIFDSKNWPPAGLNTSFYKNPEVDDLLKRASQELDAQTRADLYCQASKIIWDDAPWIFLWTQSFPIVYSSKIQGVSYLPNEKFDIHNAKPAQ
ncbi:MAG: ABC transporter substrate-binding protein [Clostridiales bacterium]|nr:ABC transporter substrate-binding protein [Clostridiales bacterium]